MPDVGMAVCACTITIYTLHAILYLYGGKLEYLLNSPSSCRRQEEGTLVAAGIRE
jgi:hypothetical protein